MSKITFKKMLVALSGILLPVLFTCCQSEEAEVQPADNVGGTVTYVMRFQGGIRDFDVQATRAAENWTNGDQLTLQFMEGGNRIVGSATYNSTKDEWTVRSARTLSTDDEEACEVYFFDHPTQTSEQQVTIGKSTVVYADTQASYLIDEETREIIVKAQLAPLTSRLRFVGKEQSTFGIAGLQAFTSYSITDNSFSTSTTKLTGTIGSNGFSDYAYVLFADASARRLTADAFDALGNQLGKACFTRTFDQTVLAPATSGRLKLPTPESLGSWQMTNRDNGQEITTPSVSAVTVGKVTYSAAPVEAAVTSAGNGTVMAAGFVYAKTANPDFNSQKVAATAANTFSARITGLEEKTTYYVRAFVQNERGTVLGAQQVFTTTEKPDGTSFERNDFEEEQGWD